MTSGPSILDVLETALGGRVTASRASRLTADEVDLLFDVVNAFYGAWIPEDVPEGTLRVHMGGWMAKYPPSGIARDLFNYAALYAHEVLVYDPVAAYFQPELQRLRPLPEVSGLGITGATDWVRVEATVGYEPFRHNLEAHRSHLELAFRSLEELAPWIRAGIALPIPHLRLVLSRQESIFTAVRHMVRDRGYQTVLESPIDREPLYRDDLTNVQVRVAPRREIDRIMQEYGEPAYYLARALAVADSAMARYLPPSGTEWAIYEQRLNAARRSVSRNEQRDLVLAPALAACDLPFLQGLRQEAVIKARSDEASFEDWRRALRIAVRGVESLPSEGERFVDEARGVLNDELVPVAEQVLRETRKSKILASGLRDTAVNLTCGAAVGGVASLATGAPVTGAIAASGGGMVSWLMRSLLPRKLSGRKAVIAQLAHGKPRGTMTGEGDWPRRDPLYVSPKRR